MHDSRTLKVVPGDDPEFIIYLANGQKYGALPVFKKDYYSLMFWQNSYLPGNGNPAYIYSTKEERENMDKKPHYRQSGIVFLLISVIFLLNAIECIIKSGWIFYIVILLVVVALIYAIASSIMIEKNK